jgi:hypothetical protein
MKHKGAAIQIFEKFSISLSFFYLGLVCYSSLRLLQF